MTFRPFAVYIAGAFGFCLCASIADGGSLICFICALIDGAILALEIGEARAVARRVRELRS